MKPSQIEGHNKTDLLLGAYSEVQNCKSIQTSASPGSLHNFQDLYLRNHKTPSSTS